MMKLDRFNRDILRALQEDSDISQRALSEKVNLSPNACWHRVQTLRKNGIITGQTTRLDRKKLDLNLVVFVMLRTRNHSSEWLDKFRKLVDKIPEVIDFYRLGGDYDYFLKVVTKDMESYDGVYQRLIDGMDFDTINSYFAMEAIAEQQPLPLDL
ncbi:MAG: transcriptional regulator [Hyphomicrobiales bacterium]|nr:Lrp/AsnC family transcriptional regulator [Hyphomicrobiales bacterium]PCJ93152.1 MAG: transcriptional regulator [Hyphomicrobiales bacterium]